MEIKFYAPQGVLDLSNIDFSTQEENSMLSDKTFTKFFFPFEIHVDDAFIHAFGDYLSDESKDAVTKIEGYLFHENKTHKAVLNIEEGEDGVLMAQIDYGLEEIPNFNKKLSELPLEKFTVPDIHLHAAAVMQKTWPQTNYNFPRIYTERYDQDSEVWDAFEGYYNNTRIESGNLVVPNNYVDSGGNIFNINIIHPCPHPIYLLKVGFKDAGFDLVGDILSDPDLQKRWVFSGTEYFSMKAQTRLYAEATQMDYYFDEAYSVFRNGVWWNMRKRRYNRTLSNLLQGNYIVKGAFRVKAFHGKVICQISSNGSVVWEHNQFYDAGVSDLSLPVDIIVPLNQTSNEIMFFVEFIPINKDASDYEVIDFQLTSDVLLDTSATTEDTKAVNNANEIDLSKAVPEMTFGEYVNGIKNFLNYDFTPVGSKIYMNRLGKNEPSGVIDFTAFSVKNPKKKFLTKRSFKLNFPEFAEPYKINSMYYDVEGKKLNGVAKEDTNVIDINAYPLPLAKPKESLPLSAIDVAQSSDVIGLVYYDGLVGGVNESKDIPGLLFPELFDKNWLRWLRQRIRGTQYEWSKEVNAEEFSLVSVKDYIFCNNNIHLISSLNKEKSGDNSYVVDIITETIT